MISPWPNTGNIVSFAPPKFGKSEFHTSVNHYTETTTEKPEFSLIPKSSQPLNFGFKMKSKHQR